MSLGIILFILFLSFLFIAIEIFFIPGTTIAGIIGVVMLIVSIALSYSYLGVEKGNIILLSSLALGSVLTVVGIRWLQSNKVGLKKELTGKVNLPETGNLSVGELGKTFTSLRPFGKALFGGKIIDVQSTGDYIDDNKEIEIVKITNQGIFVNQK
ncbi:MAG: hypothetical protein R2798_14075 [Chitinophagales bacterium]|nr:hypothetical protein [Bacteroidota bacterium]MCB9043416.1 hypothetical protein [Chitinophagales bacterium]